MNEKINESVTYVQSQYWILILIIIPRNISSIHFFCSMPVPIPMITLKLTDVVVIPCHSSGMHVADQAPLQHCSYHCHTDGVMAGLFRALRSPPCLLLLLSFTSYFSFMNLSFFFTVFQPCVLTITSTLLLAMNVPTLGPPTPAISIIAYLPHFLQKLSWPYSSQESFHFKHSQCLQYRPPIQLTQSCIALWQLLFFLTAFLCNAWVFMQNFCRLVWLKEDISFLIVRLVDIPSLSCYIIGSLKVNHFP